MTTTEEQIRHAIGERILDHIQYWQEQVKTGRCDTNFAIEGVIHSTLTLLDNEQILDLEDGVTFSLTYQFEGKKRWHHLDTHLHDEVYAAQTRQEQREKEQAPPQPKPKSNVVLIAESRLSILDAAYAYWAYDDKRNCIAFEDAMQEQLMVEDVQTYINRVVLEGHDEADLAKLRKYVCDILKRPDAWPKEMQ